MRPVLALTALAAASVAGCGHAPALPAPDAASGQPALFATLFGGPGHLVYAWSYAVDTHDEEGSVHSVEAQVHCTTSPVARVPEGEILEVDCATQPADAVDVEPWRGGTFLLTPAGLYLVASADPADVSAALADPPYLAATPAPSESSSQKSDGNEDPDNAMTWTEGTRVFAEGDGWCREDTSTEAYGSRIRLCFTPRAGLVSIELDGRNGPSTESYELEPSGR